MKVNRTFGLLLGLSLCLTAGVVHSAAAAPKTSVLLDGYPLAFPAEPRIVNGYTMVPFRAIAESLGISVQWDGTTRTITAAKGGTTVRMQLHNPTVTVNGAPVRLPVAPFEQDGHTLIPLSFFSTQFGAAVSWDGTTRTVSVTSPRERMYSLAFYAISSFSQRQLIPSFDAVAFGWARIDGSGQLTLTGNDFYWPKPAGAITPEVIVEDAKQQGTAPYLMVFATDGTGELTRLLSDPALRQQAVQQIVSLANERGFAGVALDFEGLGLDGDIAAARQQYTDFVRLLAHPLHESGLSLSLVLHPPNGAYKGYDFAALGQLADELILMAYAYGDEKQPEPIAKVDEAVKLAMAQVPKEKLLLGISLASENEQTVNGKIGLAKRYGLKGIALWRLGLLTEPERAQIERTIEWKQGQPVTQ